MKVKFHGNFVFTFDDTKFWSSSDCFKISDSVMAKVEKVYISIIYDVPMQSFVICLCLWHDSMPPDRSCKCLLRVIYTLAIIALI